VTISRSRTLRHQVIALCVAVGGLLLVLAAGAATAAAQNRDHIDTLVTTATPARVYSEELLSALVNQESGVNGYAVSGNRDDLAPYEQGLAQERELIAKMDQLLDHQPAIRQQLRMVQEQAAQWRGTVADPVINLAATDTDAAQQLLNPAARARFDALRASVDELQRLIRELSNRVSEDARESGNAVVLLLVVAAAVVVLAGAALLASLSRLVIGPVTGLAQQVREVATGDYQRRIDVGGPPELAQLARDVEGMRRRIAADLTEVREARERIEWVNSQLQKQAEELVRSNRDLEQFAYVASHDLQEPLRKVASFCQLLQRRYAGQLDERADQYISFAVDGAQRMQRLINDLLAFSRIGRLTSGLTEVDLNDVMNQVAGQTESAREYAGGELTWTRLPVTRGEETLLTNLLANLVSNSLKFRRPDVPPRVHISARRVDDEWEITCQDNGIGVEPEFADKIFVIFQRLHAKDAYPGTGIGLAIVKKIVEYHGGRVWIEPAAEVGTTIRFTLPVVEEYATVNAAIDPAATGGGAVGGEAPTSHAEAGDDAVPSDDAGEGPAEETDNMKETVV